MKFIKTFEGYSEKEEESIQKDIDSGKLVLIEPGDKDYADHEEFHKLLKTLDKDGFIKDPKQSKKIDDLSYKMDKSNKLNNRSGTRTYNGKNYWMMKSGEKLEEEKNYEQIKEFSIACSNGDMKTVKRMLSEFGNAYLITARNCNSLSRVVEKGKVEVTKYILDNYLDDIIKAQISRGKTKKDLFSHLKHWVETSDKLDNKDSSL